MPKVGSNAAARGYRYVGPSVVTNVPDARLPPAASAPTLPEKPSVAVLPFSNLSGDPEYARMQAIWRAAMHLRRLPGFMAIRFLRWNGTAPYSITIRAISSRTMCENKSRVFLAATPSTFCKGLPRFCKCVLKCTFAPHL